MQYVLSTDLLKIERSLPQFVGSSIGSRRYRASSFETPSILPTDDGSPSLGLGAKLEHPVINVSSVVDCRNGVVKRNRQRAESTEKSVPFQESKLSCLEVAKWITKR